jgi:imidazolonepropionase
LSSDLLLKNIKKVYGITGSGEKQPFSIWIQDGFIEAIGSVDAVRGKGNNQRLESAKVLDCSDMIVLPGFVDAHTHLLFAGTREKEFYWRAEGVSYMRIIEEGGGIYKTVKAVEEASEEVLIKNGIRFLDKALQFGTTTIEIKSGYGLYPKGGRGDDPRFQAVC